MHATYWIKITSSTTPTVYVQYYNEFSRKVMKRDCSLLRCPQSLLWFLIPLNFELSCTCRCICTDNSRQVTVNCFDRGGGPVRGSISCINYHEPPEFVSALPYYVDSQSYGKSVFWNVSINLYTPMRCARFLFLYMPPMWPFHVQPTYHRVPWLCPYQASRSGTPKCHHSTPCMGRINVCHVGLIRGPNNFEKRIKV